MIKRTLSPLAALALTSACFCTPAAAQEGTTVYSGGHVWNGSGFSQRDLATVDGVIVDLPTEGEMHQRVDASGQYIVPAFANAHTHVTPSNDAGSAYFIDNGVYYVWNPNTVILGEAAQAYFARPDTYSVAVAQGGITEPGGHPEKLYVDILQPRVYPDMDRADFLGNAFHYGETEEQIIAALDLLVSQGADFVKAYLLYSEEYEARRGEEAFYGLRGLNPDLMPFLVEQAQARDLPVTVHVETGRDLLTAAEAGAAIAMHLPAYSRIAADDPLPRLILTDEQARRIAQSGLMLVATYSLAPQSLAYDGLTEAEERQLTVQTALQRSNLALLHRHGARFLIGTDTQGAIFDEVERLDELAVFSRRELLQIVFETGAALFPERRVGCLVSGCEADFLLLSDDPVEDLQALRAIDRRVLAGTVREPSAD